MSFTDKLNFTTSQVQAPSKAVKIDNRKDVNYYETLCMYCANNNINVTVIDDNQFIAAVEIMEAFNSTDRGEYFFWVDD